MARRHSATSGAAAFLLVAWEVVALAVGSPALPPPTLAIPAFVDQLPELWAEIVISAWRVLAAMAIGTVLAVPLGLVIGPVASAGRVRGAGDLPDVPDPQGRVPAGASSCCWGWAT